MVEHFPIKKRHLFRAEVHIFFHLNRMRVKCWKYILARNQVAFESNRLERVTGKGSQFVIILFERDDSKENPFYVVARRFSFPWFWLIKTVGPSFIYYHCSNLTDVIWGIVFTSLIIINILQHALKYVIRTETLMQIYYKVHLHVYI